MEKLVSIITPAYNCSNFIPRTIESVLNQTYQNWEMIIVDDCSKDNTIEILENYSKSDNRIKFYKNESNLGSAFSRNRAMDYSKGNYIAFLDSDDSWLPEKLNTQISFMEKTGAKFTYGDYMIVDKKTDEQISSMNAPSVLTYKDLLKGCPIGCLTAAYNQDALGKVYMPNVRSGQDWGLWLALTRKGIKAYKYPGCEALYYVGENSLSSNKMKKTLNIFRIYRNEENLNIFSSLWYLYVHTLYVIRKGIR
ncbi:glycosyltransferase [Psychroflexus sp. CAK57W]|uniref:glycosyltransferase family 2 protein n=1 Tax=Psychroflexus curvus TaxID=2873595 RepID=UPI001CCE5D7E|nr:glycosyltransferase family 2 protein [Psychroflexus curvus]MBZ9786723.1 glycosyltransferase [Psychroflexus curvus]